MTVGDHKKIDRRLYLPRYTFSEADHLANVTPGTTRRWLGGYAYRAATGQHVARPPVTPRTAVDGAASFIDLVEVVAIGRLKERGLSLTQIRKLVANCQEVLGVDRPLVHLQFKTGGREVFADQRGALVELGRTKGQRAWDEVLGPFLEELDYAGGIARRWWPLGKSSPVVIDPDFGFGLPVIAGSGVRTEIIRERFQAGDLEQEIAADFNIDPVEVQRALQFEIKRAA